MTATSERTLRRLIEKRDRAQEKMNAANDVEVTCPNCQSLVTVLDVTTCGACERFICESCTVFVEVMDCCSPCAVQIQAAAKVPTSEIPITEEEMEQYPGVTLPAAKRTCNRHSDCEQAEKDRAARHPGTEMPSSFHCHDDECEDCFGA